MPELLPVAALTDNYIWILHDGRDAVVVDPGEAEPVERVLAARGLALHAILLTHHHGDHVAGAATLAARHRCVVHGPDDARIAVPHEILRDGAVVALATPGVRLTVLAVPGHTRTHVALHGDDVLFCGDTLFSVGCGRLFEGTPEQMLDSLARLAALGPHGLSLAGQELRGHSFHWSRFDTAMQPWQHTQPARGIAAGSTFEMKGHRRSDQDRKYLVTSASIDVDGGDFESGKNEGEYFTCQFTAIPADQQYRPSLLRKEVGATIQTHFSGPNTKEYWVIDNHIYGKHDAAAIAFYSNGEVTEGSITLDDVGVREADGGAVAVVGFCMGGRLTFLASAALASRFKAAAAFYGRGRHLAMAAAALLLVAGFFAKQTAAPLIVFVASAMLLTRRRTVLTFAVVGVASFALCVYLQNRASQGWFWTYIFRLHQSHAFFYQRALVHTPRALATLLGPALGVAAWAGLAQALGKSSEQPGPGLYYLL